MNTIGLFSTELVMPVMVKAMYVNVNADNGQFTTGIHLSVKLTNILYVMNKRCLINVATGDFYCKMQQRLIDSFSKAIDRSVVMDSGVYLDAIHYRKGKGIDLLYWQNRLPKGSRSHEESPYGFKIHAIKAAYEMGYTSILWIDSPAYAVKEDISPIFDKIEKEGYYAMSHIDPLENYLSPECEYYFSVNKETIKKEELNLPSGSCYGFKISQCCGDKVFNDLQHHENVGLFRSEKIGFRHDETVLALILRKHSYPVFTFDPLFQSDSPECVIKSGG